MDRSIVCSWIDRGLASRCHRRSSRQISTQPVAVFVDLHGRSDCPLHGEYNLPPVDYCSGSARYELSNGEIEEVVDVDWFPQESLELSSGFCRWL